jgi:hypothetical protein
MMTLAEFTATLIEYMMQDRGWTREQATWWVEYELDEAREEYRALGAPLGDTDEGFIAWVGPRHQPPTA